MFTVAPRHTVAAMASYLLAHVHGEADCRVAYAAWRGFESPLRGLHAIASCASGDHCMFWTVQANNPDDALKQLPPYLAQRTHVSEVSKVAIR
jgi:hypothetical protein